VDDTELLAAIGRIVVESARLDYAIAILAATTEGLTGQDREIRARQIVKRSGEVPRQLKQLTEKLPGLAWLMDDIDGLRRGRNFVAHAVAQQDAVAEGHAALFIVNLRDGTETMITTSQAASHARYIQEDRRRIWDAIANQIRHRADPPGLRPTRLPKCSVSVVEADSLKPDMHEPVRAYPGAMAGAEPVYEMEMQRRLKDSARWTG